MVTKDKIGWPSSRYVFLADLRSVLAMHGLSHSLPVYEIFFCILALAMFASLVLLPASPLAIQQV
jgi:hypothetical protein